MSETEQISVYTRWMPFIYSWATISGHTLIFSYIILSHQQSKFYPCSNRKSPTDRKRTVGDELRAAVPRCGSAKVTHTRPCICLHLCESSCHNLTPRCRLCHVSGLYDDKFSTGVILVLVGEDWWSVEAGDPSPLHRDFKNLFLITPHGRGHVVTTPLSATPQEIDTRHSRSM